MLFQYFTGLVCFLVLVADGEIFEECPWPQITEESLNTCEDWKFPSLENDSCLLGIFNEIDFENISFSGGEIDFGFSYFDAKEMNLTESQLLQLFNANCTFDNFEIPEDLVSQLDSFNWPSMVDSGFIDEYPFTNTDYQNNNFDSCFTSGFNINETINFSIFQDNFDFNFSIPDTSELLQLLNSKCNFSDENLPFPTTKSFETQNLSGNSDFLTSTSWISTSITISEKGLHVLQSKF